VAGRQLVDANDRRVADRLQDIVVTPLHVRP
jgi:hypothetical protein